MESFIYFIAAAADVTILFGATTSPGVQAGKEVNFAEAIGFRLNPPSHALTGAAHPTNTRITEEDHDPLVEACITGRRLASLGIPLAGLLVSMVAQTERLSSLVRRRDAHRILGRADSGLDRSIPLIDG